MTGMDWCRRERIPFCLPEALLGIMSVTVAVQLGRGFFIYRKMIRLAKNLKKER